MTAFLIDTNLIGALFRSNPNVVRRARRQEMLYDRLHIPIIVFYEVWKGWEYRALSQKRDVRIAAKQKMREFDQFCRYHAIVPLTEEACQITARLQATRRYNGKPYRDEGDLLIAGIALANGFGVATANVADFQDIDGLIVENWLN